MPRATGRILVTAEDMIRRFDAAGGQVRHYRGTRRCLVSLIPVGQFRMRHVCADGYVPRWLLPLDLLDVLTESTTARDQQRANRILLDRARHLPPVEPTLAMLETYLRDIHVETIPRYDAFGEINAWCRIVEVCATRESDHAFSWDVLPRLNRIFEQVYDQPKEVLIS